MKAANAHIAHVMQEYDLQENAILHATALEHIMITGNEPCVDHATFVAPYEMRETFIRHWNRSGLQALSPLETREYPAEHIALIGADKKFEACDPMIGLSVSKDPGSPINEFLRRIPAMKSTSLPGKLQHVAVNIDQEIDMETFVKQLQEKGIPFMTPVLFSTQMNTRTELRQAFIACTQPYGYFVELIQRTDLPESFESAAVQEELFNTAQIDRLYKLYDHYSQKLLKSS